MKGTNPDASIYVSDYEGVCRLYKTEAKKNDQCDHTANGDPKPTHVNLAEAAPAPIAFCDVTR